tara:strand:+ start:26 stop:235 length:210 start_codon:yes stop_codon:yes gene_type:complete
MLYHLDGRTLLTYHKPHMAVIDGKVASFGSGKRHDSFIGFSCGYLELEVNNLSTLGFTKSNFVFSLQSY